MLIVAFGESTTMFGRTQVQLWYNWFKEGWEDTNDDTRPDCLSTSTTNENIEAVNKMILDNRWITIREVADNVGNSIGSCQAIFTNVLAKKRATAKIFSKLLGHRSGDVDNVQQRSRFAQKVQSSQWKRPEEPKPKKAL